MKTKWIIGTLGAMLVVSLAGNAWLGATLRTNRYNYDHSWFTASDNVRDFPYIGLSSSEIQQMLGQINSIEKDENKKKALTVTVLGNNTVQISTGILAGPLCGSGRIFLFKRTADGWVLDKKSNGFWIS